MKQIPLIIMAVMIIASLAGCAGGDPSGWSTRKTDNWFEKAEWLNGWDKIPDGSINRKLFAVSFHKNPDRWNKAFLFLKENDLMKLTPGRHDIDGDNLFVSVTDYETREPEEIRYEAHVKYIDIQYVADGYEKIGIAPLSDVVTIVEAYDAARDISFMSVKTEKDYSASPDRFFIFFPDNVHKPGIKDRFKSKVRKVVVKVKAD